jgi:hypothetical protein
MLLDDQPDRFGTYHSIRRAAHRAGVCRPSGLLTDRLDHLEGEAPRLCARVQSVKKFSIFGAEQVIEIALLVGRSVWCRPWVRGAEEFGA